MANPGETGREAIFEFTRMATEHNHVLFTIAGGLAVIEILMVAHILTGRRTGAARLGRLGSRLLSSILVLSALLNGASLVCGYFGDAALLQALKRYAVGTEWSVPATAEFMNFLQMLLLAVAIACIWLAFLFFARRLAGLLIKVEQHAGHEG
jgi:hypothetical protein